ncbi:hypothetical protein MycrhN_2731 [Mycolicibacterium rhodesiae NBB3]|uniref:AAA+ ATPase domain-containing protein n=1 Tax=Mycolicibacterium rhodesiae (strain NBB3) TaxID=710685 RepID=G8RH08_MYCRN|nr:TniB family NTP-binding protein [Mycolicibacterium rhodesiae]AEV73312.1 hypothetical protein MycrhN_2731 [Mycolicibacterium rhodesiae NBB3]
MNAAEFHRLSTQASPPEPAHLSVRQWEALSVEHRAAHLAALEKWLGHLWIDIGDLQQVCDVMTAIVRKNATSWPGAKRILGLSGPFAIGKTTLIQRWAGERYNAWTADCAHDRRGRPVYYTTDCEHDLNPVVWAGLASKAKATDVNAEILHYHGLPGKDSHKAFDAMKRHRTRVLVLDDVHFLATTAAWGREVLDHLKRLNSELGYLNATLLVVGANLEDGSLAHDPQIRARLKLQHYPTYPKPDDRPEQQRWQRVVRELEDMVLPHLPNGKRGMLFMQLAGELHYRTQGFLGDLTELVAEATLAAVADGSFAVALRHLDGVVLSERAEDKIFSS